MRKVILSMLVIGIMSALANAESCTSVGATDKKYTPQGECDYKTETRTCCYNKQWSEWDKECPAKPKVCKKRGLVRNEDTFTCGIIQNNCNPNLAEYERNSARKACEVSRTNNYNAASKSNAIGMLTDADCKTANIETGRIYFGNVREEGLNDKKFCSDQYGNGRWITSATKFYYTVQSTYCECVEWE